MRPNRILHTIRQGKIGGGETHVLNLARHLDKSVFESHVLSFTDGEMVAALRDLGVRCHVINTQLPFDLRKWSEVKSLIKELNPDIIHAHGTRACSNSFWPAKKSGKKLIYTVHGWSFHGANGSVVNSIRIRSEKFLTRKAALTINVSKADEEIGKKLFNLTNSVVIQNGVDLAYFNRENINSDIRKEYNIPGDAFLVGHIARMTLQKDPFTLFDAIYQLIKNGEKVYVLFVGEGELRNKLVEKAKSLNIDDFVKFSPFVRDVRPFLKAIDIYCLPSLWEGLPIGILEALAFNTKVVASDIPAHKELKLQFPELIKLFRTKDTFDLASKLKNSHSQVIIPVNKSKLANIDLRRGIEILQDYYLSTIG